MIQISIKGKEIKIRTTDGTTYEMDWKDLRELTRALKVINELQAQATFDTLEITLV